MAATAPAVSRSSYLLERGSQLADLAGDVAAAQGGCGGLVLVEGPPGIGEWASLTAVWSDARDAGMRVTRARGPSLSAASRSGWYASVEPLARLPARASASGC